MIGFGPIARQEPPGTSALPSSRATPPAGSESAAFSRRALATISRSRSGVTLPMRSRQYLARSRGSASRSSGGAPCGTLSASAPAARAAPDGVKVRRIAAASQEARGSAAAGRRPVDSIDMIDLLSVFSYLTVRSCRVAGRREAPARQLCASSRAPRRPRPSCGTRRPAPSSRRAGRRAEAGAPHHELVRAGRDPEQLAREFEPSAQAAARHGQGELRGAGPLEASIFHTPGGAGDPVKASKSFRRLTDARVWYRKQIVSMQKSDAVGSVVSIWLNDAEAEALRLRAETPAQPRPA